MILEILAGCHLLLNSCQDIRLAPRISSDGGCNAVQHEVEFPRCSFGAAQLSDKVNQLVEQRVRDTAGYDEDSRVLECEDGEQQRTHHSDASCERPYVRGSVVSFDCRATFDTGVHPDGNFFAINVELTGQSFRELKLADLLRDAEAASELWALVRADLKRQLEACREEDVDETDESMNERLAEHLTGIEAFHFSPTGLVFSYSHYSFGYCVLEATVPYQRLRRILKPTFQSPNS